MINPSCRLQDKNPSEVSPPLLKLVVSNPAPLPQASPSQETESNKVISSSFTFDVRLKGLYPYEMSIHDPFPYLKCDMILEVEEAPGIDFRSVTCRFLSLSDEELNSCIEENETRYGAIYGSVPNEDSRAASFILHRSQCFKTVDLHG